MNTLITAPRQFRLYGAVLAMAALLAVLLALTLTAGPTMAQDPNIGEIYVPVPLTGDNNVEYTAPIPCSEEAEWNDDTVRVETDGYFPLFEGFWDYEVGHLSDNFCPPELTETTTTHEDPESGETTTETTITRTDANIHISKTVFSVPTSYEVTVIDSNIPKATPGADGVPTDLSATIDLVDYPFLRAAVSAVKTENGSTVFANNKVWWVRLDEPGTTADETSPLKIAFSTHLMKADDWYRKVGDPVQFKFSAVHVLRAGTLQETHVVGANLFAFKQRTTDTPLDEPEWTDIKTDRYSEINLQTGQYQPLQFLFTEPGLYRMQANVQGHVRNITDPAPASPPADADWSPLSPDDTITSPDEWYTFHVGPEADMGVTITHTDETSDAGTTVTDGTADFTVTATNHGPEDTQDAVVEINLPLGLTYVDDATHTNVTSNICGVLSWQVGNLASGASETLNFTGTFLQTGPKSLPVDVLVHSSTVDDNELNDTASVVALTNGTVVTPPFFPGVEREIVDYAVPGAHVGEPVAAINPDGRELDYWLEGPCNQWFKVHKNGQVVLAEGKTLDYDTQSTYNLRINVSDGLDETGAAETGTNRTADHWIPLTIKVLDAPDGVTHPTVTFKLTPNDSEVAVTGNPVADGTTYFLRTTLNNAPEGAIPTYDWQVKGQFNALWSNRIHTSYYPADKEQAGERTYIVHIKWQGGGGITATHTLTFAAPSS